MPRYSLERARELAEIAGGLLGTIFLDTVEPGEEQLKHFEAELEFIERLNEFPFGSKQLSRAFHVYERIGKPKGYLCSAFVDAKWMLSRFAHFPDAVALSFKEALYRLQVDLLQALYTMVKDQIVSDPEIKASIRLRQWPR